MRMMIAARTSASDGDPERAAEIRELEAECAAL